MFKAIAGWRKPDKQAANNAAIERGLKLGMADWVIPRDKIQLGARCIRQPSPDLPQADTGHY